MASGSGKYKSYNAAVKAGYVTPANKRKNTINTRDTTADYSGLSF